MPDETTPIKDTSKSGNDPEAANNGSESITITRKLKDAFDKSTGPVDCVRNVCDVFWTAIGATFMLIVENVIPIAMIVVGIKYIDRQNCKPDNVALLILVGGLGILIRGLLDIIRRLRIKRSGDENLNDGLQKTLTALASLGAMFGAIWTIASWIIVFSLWGHVSYDKNSEYYCDQFLMRFSFWILMLPFIVIGVVFAVLIFAGFCVCCLAVSGKSPK